MSGRNLFLAAHYSEKQNKTKNCQAHKKVAPISALPEAIKKKIKIGAVGLNLTNAMRFSNNNAAVLFNHSNNACNQVAVISIFTKL